MQTEIAPTQATAAIPTPAVIDSAEAHLATEISALWESHSQARGELRKSRTELKLIRTNLAARLHELKSALSRPGRGGEWSGFLASKKIPRTTGDRLVSAHEKSISQDGKGTSGATKTLSDDGIAQVAKATWARLQGKLGTNQAIFLFFSRLIIESSVSHDIFDDGILICDPLYVPEPTVPAKAPAGDVIPTTAQTESSSSPAADASISGVSL